jgi:hypothetical protein
MAHLLIESDQSESRHKGETEREPEFDAKAQGRRKGAKKKGERDN